MREHIPLRRVREGKQGLPHSYSFGTSSSVRSSNTVFDNRATGLVELVANEALRSNTGIAKRGVNDGFLVAVRYSDVYIIDVYHVRELTYSEPFSGKPIKTFRFRKYANLP